MAGKKTIPKPPKAPAGELIWVWAHTPAEKELIRLGAAASGSRSMSAFLLALGLEAARKAVEKIKKS